MLKVVSRLRDGELELDCVVLTDRMVKTRHNPGGEKEDAPVFQSLPPKGSRRNHADHQDVSILCTSKDLNYTTCLSQSCTNGDSTESVLLLPFPFKFKLVCQVYDGRGLVDTQILC